MLNWREVRPLKKWVLVKSDPRMRQTKGGIALPDQLLGVERVMEGTGILLKVGNRVREVLEAPLEPGTRVCFRGFLKDASAMEFNRHEDGCQVFMLHADDILAVVGDGVTLGAFS